MFVSYFVGLVVVHMAACVCVCVFLLCIHCYVKRRRALFCRYIQGWVDECVGVGVVGGRNGYIAVGE